MNKFHKFLQVLSNDFIEEDDFISKLIWKYGKWYFLFAVPYIYFTDKIWNDKEIAFSIIITIIMWFCWIISVLLCYFTIYKLFKK